MARGGRPSARGGLGGAKPHKPLGQPCATSESVWHVFALCSLPAVLSAAASLYLEALQAYRVAGAGYLPLALVAVAGISVSVPLTHGVPGKLQYPQQWRFYQPLRGGWRFITLQLFSWLSFAATLVCAGLWFYFYASWSMARPGLWAVATVAGLSSQALMVTSVNAFQFGAPKLGLYGNVSASVASNTKAVARPSCSAGRGPVIGQLVTRAWRALRQVLQLVRMFAVVAWMTNASYVFGLCLVAPFLLLDFYQAASVSALCWSLYSLTYWSRPEQTGRWQWQGLRNSFVVKDVMRWFHGAVVLERPLDAKQQYIFGFAPHGVMPLTPAWLMHHPTWQRLAAGVDPVVLGATIFQLIPLLRELALWLGTRSVAHNTFRATLAEGKSVLVVPGGLAEMQHSRSTDTSIRLVTRHKGFVAMALRTGVPLVPIYSFGETLYFDHLSVPGLSPLLLQYLKMPLPYFRGMLGWMQLPRRVPVTVVVGEPIHVPKVAEPSAALIDQYAILFYTEMQALFTRHKDRYGHKDASLVLHYRLHDGKQYAIHPAFGTEGATSLAGVPALPTSTDCVSNFSSRSDDTFLDSAAPSIVLLTESASSSFGSDSLASAKSQTAQACAALAGAMDERAIWPTLVDRTPGLMPGLRSAAA